MKMKIDCAVCDKELVVVEKDVVTEEDIQMYTACVQCDVDGSTDIEIHLED